jgi:hypothetical protein
MAIDIERKYSLLKVCYVPATSAAFLAFFFIAATNSTNHTKKAGSTSKLISLSFLDVYGQGKLSKCE